ncbi:Uncharacterised protein [Actinobacillus pleuropneumoniae]|nr:Uncharacterised protein [Actinobacillus pleuropneumoniae]
MTCHRLGRAHGHFVCMIAKSHLHGLRFRAVTHRRRSPVSINVIHVFRRNARVADCHLHAAGCSVRIRLGNVMGIGAKTVTNHLGVNLGSAFQRVLKGFDNEHAGTFTMTKPSRPVSNGRLASPARHCGLTWRASRRNQPSPSDVWVASAPPQIMTSHRRA